MDCRMPIAFTVTDYLVNKFYNSIAKIILILFSLEAMRLLFNISPNSLLTIYTVGTAYYSYIALYDN